MKNRKLWLTLIALVFLTIRGSCAQSCVDPDGLNAFMKTTVTFYLSPGRTFQDTDKCSPDGKSVWEYHCPSASDVWNIKSVACENGCHDGACRPAYRCIDTDPTNDPEKVGTLTIEENGVVTRTSDSCDQSGRVLYEVSCASSNKVERKAKPCIPGCVAGRCGPPAYGVDSCFFKVEVTIKDLHRKPVMEAPKVREVVGRFAGRLLFPYEGSPQTGRGKLEVKNSAGAPIASYQFSPYSEFFIEGKEAPVFAMSTSGTFEGYVPFRADAKEIVISYAGKSVKKELPTPVCAPSCVTQGREGRFAIGQVCCPGTTQQKLNAEVFTCSTPASTPGPTPMASR